MAAFGGGYFSVMKSGQKNFGAGLVVAWRRGVDFAGCKAGTARRRGVPFVRTRRRGLRSMSGHPAYALGNPPTLRRSSFPQRASRPAGGPIPKHAWGCAPRPPNAQAAAGYALKVPAAHFYVEIVDRVPLPRSGGGGRGRGQMRLRLPLERICAQYGFRFFNREKSKFVASTAKRQGGLSRGKLGPLCPVLLPFAGAKGRPPRRAVLTMPLQKAPRHRQAR